MCAKQHQLLVHEIAEHTHNFGSYKPFKSTDISQESRYTKQAHYKSRPSSTDVNVRSDTVEHNIDQERPIRTRILHPTTISAGADYISYETRDHLLAVSYSGCLVMQCS